MLRTVLIAAYAACSMLMITAAASEARAQTRVVPGTVQAPGYRADLNALAGSPRQSGSPGWQAAQELVAKRFAELGYTTERQGYEKARPSGIARGVNITGTLTGRSKADEFIVVSAHYDSLPEQHGADDNASGVAGVLALAEAFAHTQPERSLIVAVWDEEENGLVGSAAWAELARRRGMNLVHAYIYEMIGYRDTRPHTQSIPKGLDWLYPAAKTFLEGRDYAGDSIVLVGTDTTLMQDFVDAAADRDLPALPLHIWWRLRMLTPPDLRRSDHDSFWRNGYQATMITDTANFRNPNYHRITDAVDTIDIDFACSVVQSTVGTVHRQLNLP